MMGVGVDGKEAAGFFGLEQEFVVEVLAIRIGIDFNGFAEFGGARENFGPISGEAEAVVVNAAAGMAEDVDGGIFEGGEVAFGLVFDAAQGGVKGTDDDVEIAEAIVVEIAFAIGRQV